MAVSNPRAPRERSAIAGMHIDDPQGPPVTVYADCILTRRKRHHMICDHVDSVLFRSRWWSDVIEWLEAEGISTYEVVTDRSRYVVTVSRHQQGER